MSPDGLSWLSGRSRAARAWRAFLDRSVVHVPDLQEFITSAARRRGVGRLLAARSGQ